MKQPYDRRLASHFDWPLFVCTALIVALGLLNLHSATFNLPVARYFRSQFLWAGIGFLFLFSMVLFDYRRLTRLVYPFYGLVLVLLVLVMLKGRTAQGAQRWVQIGPLSIQPSELAKLAMALCLARYFHARREKGALGIRGLLIPGLLVVVPFGLVLKQPDLGTALVILMTALAMILFIGVERRIIAVALVLTALSAPLVWKYALHGYQKDRVITFLNPEKFSQGKGYQVIQSMVAIGSGELTGKGYLKGSQSKLQFLPKQYTDFVFSNFAEEFGFLGSMILLGLYAAFTFLGVNVAYTAKESFGMLLSLGLTSFIAGQAAINLGMETGALPVVGVALPLFSYGGTSLLTSLLSVGILLNVSMRRFIF
ncbi:MAG: rod shape-determining protein RodA [Pseudomonadota bacterium]